jgi:hypothetical protein
LITFRAHEPGSTTITFTNCYRGCADDLTRADSREVSWTVTVSR